MNKSCFREQNEYNNLRGVSITDPVVEPTCPIASREIFVAAFFRFV